MKSPTHKELRLVITEFTTEKFLKQYPPDVVVCLQSGVFYNTYVNGKLFAVVHDIEAFKKLLNQPKP